MFFADILSQYSVILIFYIEIILLYDRYNYKIILSITFILLAKSIIFYQ